MAKTRSGYKKVKSLFGKYKQVLEDWDLKKLEKVGKVIGGGTPDSTNMAYWNGEILWAIPTDITKLQTNQIENTERKITKEGLDNSSAKLLPKGTILITSRATIGECAIATKPISTNQGFQSIICNNDNFDRMYIFYSIKYHKSELLRLAYGTTFLEINKSEIKKVMLSIPSSILEQQKIASILSGVDALIESTQHIIEKTEKLKKGLMQNLLTRGIGHTKFKKIKWLFGKEIEIPEKWNITRLIEQCIQKPEYGAGESAIEKDLKLPRYIRITDLNDDGSLRNKEWKSIKENAAKNYLLNNNDILFARTGATVGKSYLYTDEYGRCAFAGYLIRFQPDQTKLNSKFLFHYIHSIYYWKYIKSIQTWGVQPNVNAEQYSNLLIFLSPIHEQQKIASILSGVDAVRCHDTIALIILRIKLAIFLILFVWISVVQISVFQTCAMSLYLHFVAFDILHMTEFSCDRI